MAGFHNQSGDKKVGIVFIEAFCCCGLQLLCLLVPVGSKNSTYPYLQAMLSVFYNFYLPIN